MRHLERCLDMLKRDDLVAQDEVDVFVPLWQQCPYQLAIVFEALGRVTSVPVVMLRDTFKAILSSLVNKEACVHWDDYTMRHRYWVVVTADPGAGKSPVLKLILDALKSVMAEVGSCFAGCKEENYHLASESTHAAFTSKLQ